MSSIGEFSVGEHFGNRPEYAKNAIKTTKDKISVYASDKEMDTDKKIAKIAMRVFRIIGLSVAFMYESTREAMGFKRKVNRKMEAAQRVGEVAGEAKKTVKKAGNIVKNFFRG